MENIKEIAKKLVAPGKGILAADESFGTIKKRFDKIGIQSGEENRRAYREMLFAAPGIEKYISGVIEFDETVRQKSKDGRSLPEILSEKNIVPGIKVDEGKEPIPQSPQETHTIGLEGLEERLKEYYFFGCRFTKWRAALKITEELPSDLAVDRNAQSLAKYAKISQEQGFVPIVEPEVLMDGDHTLERCMVVTEKVLGRVFEELEKEGVDFEGMLLKTNMILPGKESGQEAGSREIAETTLRALQIVPDGVPGIVFLSGGQSEIEATENLNEMNKIRDPEKHPWELSFSYGRALQNSALEAWAGKSENIEVARQVFLHRAKMNSLARAGEYSKEMEN